MPKHCYRIILIVLTIACGVCDLVTMPIAVLTATMAFYTPGSDSEIWPWVAFFLLLSIPLWFVIGAIVAWALHLHHWPRMALVVAAMPLGAAAVGWLLLT